MHTERRGQVPSDRAGDQRATGLISPKGDPSDFPGAGPPWSRAKPVPGPARVTSVPSLSRSLAQAGQLGPRGVEVALGAFGPGAQLAARLLEHLRAGFQRSAQLVAPA